MSALKDALKSPVATSKNNSSKGPTFYSRAKNQFIDNMANHVDPTVRIAAAGDDNIPAGALKSMLDSEQDVDVLRTILMNPRTPLKAISRFSESDRADDFADDTEVTEYLKSRVTIPSTTDEE